MQIGCDMVIKVDDSMLEQLEAVAQRLTEIQLNTDDSVAAQEAAHAHFELGNVIAVIEGEAALESLDQSGEQIRQPNAA